MVRLLIVGFQWGNYYIINRTDLFSAICIGITAYLIISSKEWNYTSDPSLMGVALTSIL